MRVLHSSMSMQELCKRKFQQEVRGVINLNIGEEPSLSGLTEAQVDDNTMGVIFSHQYTLKGGPKEFVDRAEEATTKELEQIHGMGT